VLGRVRAVFHAAFDVTLGAPSAASLRDTRGRVTLTARIQPLT
jgi:hypothetical protein